MAAVAYVRTAPREVLGGDNGEFAALFAAGGVAHPPGFPTMVFWLRAWHALLFFGHASPAHGAALATVVVGVGAVYALQRACVAWGVSRGATAIVSAAFALGPVAWDQGSHAEVFAMNALFAGLILGRSAPLGPQSAPRDGWWLVGLGLLAGVATGGHQTIVLLAPSGVYAAIVAMRRSPQPRLAALAGGGALAVGILLPEAYLYLTARAANVRTQPVWLDSASFEGIFDHFRRSAYGTFSLHRAGPGAPDDPVAAAMQSVFATTRDLLGLPLLVPVAVVVARVRARRPDASRPHASGVRGEQLALVGSYLLAGPAFASRMNVMSAGAGPRVAERFYLLPEVIAALAVGLALDVLAPKMRLRVAVPAALGTAFAAGWIAFPSVREARRPDVAAYLENVLATAPTNAVIVASGDQCWGAFLYAQYAEHRRPDLAIVYPGLVRLPWYRRQVAAVTGVDLETPAGGPIGPKTLMRRLLQTRRPVFYTDWPDPTIERTPHDSFGPLMRVWADGDERPSVEALLADNVVLYRSFRIDPAPPPDPSAWGRPLYYAYARAWVELAEKLETAGRPTEAAECMTRAAALAPWALL